MSQTSMNISLPESLREWVQGRVAAGGYGTASEYFRDLVREDQKRRSREHTDRILVAAIESGDPAEMTAADWATIRKTVRAKIIGKAKARK